MSTAIGVSLPRLATAVGKAVSEYAVLGKTPGFTADFIKNRYPGYTSLSSAITHARAGNATMTDGYGPELVTNGGFDSDSDWTKGTGWSISGGKARSSATTYQTISQSLSNTAGIYEVRVQASGNTNSDGRLVIDLDGDQYLTGYGDDANGAFVAYLEATADSTIAFGASTRATARFNGTIDSVSVREMPVLKWGPHNLLTYSEDFDNAAWSKTSTTITANSATAPDGTTTADTLSHTADGAIFSQFFNVPIVRHTVGIFVKQVDHRWFRIFADVGSVWFDLDSGTVGTVNSGLSDASITDVGNGWYRCEVSVVTPTASFSVSPLLATADAAYTESVGTSVYIWGAHAYRSDLGGMVDNPDQPLSRASYVPTTSSALYLPRIGHHVYSSAWVNEGVLAESEARTNLLTYSLPDNTNYTKDDVTITEDDAISPDGTENAVKLSETAVNSRHFVYDSTNVSFVSGQAYTHSAIAKAGTNTVVQLLGTSTTFGVNVYANFDLENGVIGTVASDVDEATMESLGNGWYRCSITADATATASASAGFVVLVRSTTAVRASTYTGDTSKYIYAYHSQCEQASTPSSLIPTSGSTVSRAAETFTIPSANLPWPEPNYIGSELVTNGTFDGESTASWTAVNATLDATDNELTITDTAGGGYVYQEITTEIGKLYNVSYTTIDARHAYVTIRSGSAVGTVVGSLSGWNGTGPTGNYSYTFVATATTHYLQINDGSSSQIQVTVDNVSVREIDPLSVSIGMEGRITYADEGGNTATFLRWREDADNYINHLLYTTGSETGEINIFQRALGTTTQTTSASQYQPDILVPYNIASRHGSTFLNLAKEGVVNTAITTPTALPDLSSTDLNLAYDYMGTISEFRVWDRDITDDGLEEATNPSLEPSLSLTFEGIGTNSFVVNNWSE